MKNTPEHLKGRSMTPSPSKEVGLLDRLKLKEEEMVSAERVQEIMHQLENGGHEIRHGEFVPTFQQNDDMFAPVDAPVLRKELKDAPPQNKHFPIIKTEQIRQKLFDDLPNDIPNLDKGVSYRKQMEETEALEKQKTIQERLQQEAERNQRIESRVGSTTEAMLAMIKSEPVGGGGAFMNRRRASANIRATGDQLPEEVQHLATLAPLKTETIDDDAEFVRNMNKQFNVERGMKILPVSANMSFSQLSSNAPRKKMRLKCTAIGSRGLGLVKAFQAPKILGVKPRLTNNEPLSPNQSTPTTPNLSEMENVPFTTDILSTAPLMDSHIGPKKPVEHHRTYVKRQTSGIVLPSSFDMIKTEPPSTGMFGRNHLSLFDMKVPKSTIPPLRTESHLPDTGSSGLKLSSPIMMLPKEPHRDILVEVPNTMPPPPVIRRDLPAPPVVSSASKPDFSRPPPPLPPNPSVPPPLIMNGQPFIPPPSFSMPIPNMPVNQPQIYLSPPTIESPFNNQSMVPFTDSLIKSEPLDLSDQDSEPKYKDVYLLYPTVWLGFVGIKSKTAMVQLHHIDGNQHIGGSVLPKELLHPSADGSKHPILKISNRVKLDNLTLVGVRRRWTDSAHKCCTMIALPYGVDQSDTSKQNTSLQQNFMKYFSDKNAAGSLVVKNGSSQWLVYFFPPCDFMNEVLNEKAPDLRESVAGLPKLMIAIMPK